MLGRTISGRTSYFSPPPSLLQFTNADSSAGHPVREQEVEDASPCPSHFYLKKSSMRHNRKVSSVAKGNWFFLQHPVSCNLRHRNYYPHSTILWMLSTLNFDLGVSFLNSSKGHILCANTPMIPVQNGLPKLSFLLTVVDSSQGCRNVYFQTKNPSLCKYWRALEWKLLFYSMAIWNISWSFGIIYGHLVL
jgi:hypothetical protein